MTGWDEIGVLHVLALGQAKHKTVVAAKGDSNDAEFDALNEYIDVLESALEKLGVKVHDNGAVTAAETGVTT